MHMRAFQAVENWFFTDQASFVSAAFIEQLKKCNDIITNMHGENLLQIGVAGEHKWLSLFNYKKKWLVSPCTSSPSQSISLFCFPKFLPFDEASMDCIIAPLSLEPYTWQEHPLDEIDRILKPMGYVVILGLSAISLWNIALRLEKLPYLSKDLINPMSIFKLKNALLHRGYSLSYLEPFFYIPPIKNKIWLKRLEIFNELGKIISPCPGGFYCMIVQKYIPQHTGHFLEQLFWEYKERSADMYPVCCGNRKVYSQPLDVRRGENE